MKPKFHSTQSQHGKISRAICPLPPCAAEYPHLGGQSRERDKHGSWAGAISGGKVSDRIESVALPQQLSPACPERPKDTPYRSHLALARASAQLKLRSPTPAPSGCAPDVGQRRYPRVDLHAGQQRCKSHPEGCGSRDTVAQPSVRPRALETDTRARVGSQSVCDSSQAGI